MRAGFIINESFNVIKEVTIYKFILDLEDTKIKLTCEDYNEYIDAIAINKKLKQWIIILMIIIEVIILIL